LDDLINDMVSGTKDNASSASSASEGEGHSNFTLDDLDSLMAEVESSETRRRQPAMLESKKLGARKTVQRKTVQSALDGQDLDAILDTIMGAAAKKAEQDKSSLGWGVVNTDRKFDLRAPEHTPVGDLCECTIIVTLPNGERTRVPLDAMNVTFVGMQVRSSFEDNGDGTYAIKFIPPNLGKLQMNIDAYGVRQFEWQIESCSPPDPETCQAKLASPAKVGQELKVSIIACDSTGQRFRVGGAHFNLGFAGVGQLQNVSLEDQLNGEYILKATPSARGEYMVYVSLGDVDLKCSPVHFVVQ